MIGEDACGFTAIARYSYLVGLHWMTHYRVAAFAWHVPEHDGYRELYSDIYALSFVKGVDGELADTSLSL